MGHLIFFLLLVGVFILGVVYSEQTMALVERVKAMWDASKDDEDEHENP